MNPDSKTILIVDDSATMRNVMSVYLMGRDVNLVMAEDGARALRLLRLMKIDLVIADVNMPNLDGLSFVARVRQASIPSMARIPIVLMTGSPDPEIESRAVIAGVDAFLRKPLDSATVTDVVERLLREKGKA